MKPLPSFTQLGTIARACLAPGQRGKILAVFSNAIYLLTDSGELFWIATTDIPMHRRCAQTSSLLPRLSAGSPFNMQDHHLMIDPGFIFDIDHAPLWNVPHLTPHYVLEITKLSAHIQAFFSNLDVSQARGFGIFIPRILSLSQNESISFSPHLADPILLFAQPLVLEMARACIEHQTSRIASLMGSFIGLGAGLTPSGDDFLGGMLFALKILQFPYPDQFADYAVPVETYRLRTHLISFTLLNDLANGHAIAPLHSIINGLLSSESLDSIYPFISHLTQIGHSTGWDLLTGLLAGLLVTYRSNYFISSFQTTRSMEA